MSDAVAIVGRSKGSLSMFDAAKAALAQASKVDDVIRVRDRAEQMRLYARQARDYGLMQDALEIHIRAEHRLGLMMVVMKSSGDLNRGGRPSATRGAASRVTLKDIGVGRKLSMRAQQYAALPETKFEELVAQRRQGVAARFAVPVRVRRTTGSPSERRRLFDRRLGDVAHGSLRLMSRLFARLADEAVPPSSLTPIRQVVSETRLRELMAELENLQ